MELPFNDILVLWLNMNFRVPAVSQEHCCLKYPCMLKHEDFSGCKDLIHRLEPHLKTQSKLDQQDLSSLTGQKIFHNFSPGRRWYWFILATANNPDRAAG